MMIALLMAEWRAVAEEQIGILVVGRQRPVLRRRKIRQGGRSTIFVTSFLWWLWWLYYWKGMLKLMLDCLACFHDDRDVTASEVVSVVLP